MANYIPYARSNRFKVKDVNEFQDWVADFEITAHREGDTFVLLFDGEDGIPTWGYNEETDEDYEVDFPLELSRFLADGEVAILNEVGFEKMRYLVGVSIAVNSRGETLVVNISDIHHKIEEAWGIADVDPCEY